MIKKWLIVSIEGFLVIGFFLFICNNERFQQKICPQIYWENKVKELNASIHISQCKINHLEVLLERQKHLASFDKKFGWEHSKKNPIVMQKKREQKTYLLKNEILVSQKKLKACQAKLEQASYHLHRVHG